MRLEGHRSGEDGRRRRTRDNQGSPTCARGGSRRNTHARPELHASTPPLEALKVVLSELWLTFGERTSTFQHEGEYSLNYRPRTISHAMNTCAGGTRDAAQKLGGRTRVDAQRELAGDAGLMFNRLRSGVGRAIQGVALVGAVA